MSQRRNDDFTRAEELPLVRYSTERKILEEERAGLDRDKKGFEKQREELRKTETAYRAFMLRKVLDAVEIPAATKSGIWRHVFDQQGAKELETLLNHAISDDNLKAEIWDIKFPPSLDRG